MIARAVLLLFFFGLSCGAAGQGLIQDIDARLPRDFGYLIGDPIVQRLSVTVSGGLVLDGDSLPRPGRVDRWLWLHEPVVATRGATTDIELRYQLLTAPAQAQQIIVPEKTLSFTDGEHKVPLIIEPFVFTALPMIHDGVVDPAFMEVKPALPPPHLPAGAHRLAMAAGIASAITGLLLLVYVHGTVPGLRRSRGPFAVALRKIARAGRDRGDYLACVRHVHHAFDATAGAVLVARDLPSFFAAHGEFHALKAPIETFYEASQRLFFAAAEVPPADGPQWRRLVELCRACRDVERGLGA